MARPDSLDEIEAEVWAQLAQAPKRRSHGWRIGVLATADGDGADARSVVLREVDAGNRCLVFFTDSRSPKVRQLQQHPRATLVLWSADLGWQLRLKVQLSIETSGLAVSSRWARLKMSPAAQDYLSPLPPGSAIGTPVPVRDTREHFGVLMAQVLSVDWLELHADGHRRASFDAEGRRWLVP
ncbi:MAG: hypothetical protein RJA10_459 [Pseudomonadota bacterium]|jgi:pyridoxamine 5'-phosphate oxidase